MVRVFLNAYDSAPDDSAVGVFAFVNGCHVPTSVRVFVGLDGVLVKSVFYCTAIAP
jgi:hypothetical protein